MLKTRNAFTMAELIMAVAVIGLLASFMIPAMQRFAPDRNKALLKKAANTAERIIYEMYNDDELYPRIGRDGVTEYVGFDNTERIVFMGNDYQGSTKFCGIFVRKLSAKSDGGATPSTSGVCVSKNNIENANGSNAVVAPTVVSIDGIGWYLPVNDFSNKSVKKFIYVDVNGPDKKPNCYASHKNSTTCLNPDIFKFRVDEYGNVDFFDEAAEEQLKLLQSTDLFKRD